MSNENENTNEEPAPVEAPVEDNNAEPKAEQNIQTDEEVDAEGKLKSERERDAQGFEQRQAKKERDLAIKQAVLDEQEKRLQQQEHLKPPQQPIVPVHQSKVVGDPASYGYQYNPEVPPIRDNFLNEETYEIDDIAYGRAIAHYNQQITRDTIAEETRISNERNKRDSLTQSITQKEDAYVAANPNSDYHEVVNAAMPLLKTLDPSVIEAIFGGDNPCDVMKKVASDVSIINRLKSNNPIQVGMELSKLQNSIKTAERVVSNASEPPVNPKANVSSSGKRKTDMSRSEYSAKRRAELGMK